MLTLNKLKKNLASNAVTYGTWCVLPSPDVVEILAHAGLDFVIVDMEHGPSDYVTATNMIRSAEGQSCTPLVRVPFLDESAILRALDIGAHGVVIPQISSLEAAKRAVKYTYYPPVGERGFSPFTRAGQYSHRSAQERPAQLNAETLLCLLIEGIEGLDALPSILAECGDAIDVIYLGVYDLSKVAGQMGNVDHPDILAIAKRFIAQIRDAGIAAGILCNDAAAVSTYTDLGATFIALQNDTGLISNLGNAFIQDCRSAEK